MPYIEYLLCTGPCAWQFICLILCGSHTVSTKGAWPLHIMDEGVTLPHVTQVVISKAQI